MESGDEMESLTWKKEIIELHEFFEGWLAGALQNDDHTFERLERALAKDFAIVSPGGVLVERASLLETLRASHGGRRGLKIWIENALLRKSSGALLIATYEEWQEVGGQKRGRQSTVVFKTSKSASNEWLWLHVHETWLPVGER